MWGKFLFPHYFQHRRIFVVIFPEVQRDAIFFKSPTYAWKMFTNSNLKGPSDPPNVLEATWHLSK